MKDARNWTKRTALWSFFFHWKNDFGFCACYPPKKTQTSEYCFDIAWTQTWLSEPSVIKDNRIKNIWKETLFSSMRPLSCLASAQRRRYIWGSHLLLFFSLHIFRIIGRCRVSPAPPLATALLSNFVLNGWLFQDISALKSTNGSHLSSKVGVGLFALKKVAFLRVCGRHAAWKVRTVSIQGITLLKLSLFTLRNQNFTSNKISKVTYG